nr:hypothetical protein [Tanacetum cinerariifolium]
MLHGPTAVTVAVMIITHHTMYPPVVRVASLTERQSPTTQEYPSLIDTFFMAHTVTGEFLGDEDRRIYRGHIPSAGRVLPARATASPSTPAHESTLNSLHKKVDFMMSLFKSDSKYSDIFSQFESGGTSGSGGYGDDEESADDQDDEDEDGDGDS